MRSCDNILWCPVLKDFRYDESCTIFVYPVWHYDYGSLTGFMKLPYIHHEYFLAFDLHRNIRKSINLYTHLHFSLVRLLTEYGNWKNKK